MTAGPKPLSDAWQSAITVVQEVEPPFIPAAALAMTIVVEWPPGSPGMPAHRHSGPAFGYVLQGEMVFELEGEPARVVSRSWKRKSSFGARTAAPLTRTDRDPTSALARTVTMYWVAAILAAAMMGRFGLILARWRVRLVRRWPQRRGGRWIRMWWRRGPRGVELAGRRLPAAGRARS